LSKIKVYRITTVGKCDYASPWKHCYPTFRLQSYPTNDLPEKNQYIADVRNQNCANYKNKQLENNMENIAHT